MASTDKETINLMGAAIIALCAAVIFLFVMVLMMAGVSNQHSRLTADLCVEKQYIDARCMEYYSDDVIFRLEQPSLGE